MNVDTSKLEFIQTYSGLAFSLRDPRPEQVNLDDICHSLAMQCRFTGHVKEFYSTAEHSILVASIVQQGHPSLVFDALMHDAAEAYISDLSTPLKHSAGLEGYREVEKRVEWAIKERFNLSRLSSVKTIIKQADRRALALEAEVLLTRPKMKEWQDMLDSIGPHGLYYNMIACHSPRVAEERFSRACYNALSESTPK